MGVGMTRKTAWFAAALGIALFASPAVASEGPDAEPDDDQGLSSTEQELDESEGVLYAAYGEGVVYKGSPGVPSSAKKKRVGGVLLATLAFPVLVAGGGALIYVGWWSSSTGFYVLGGIHGVLGVACLVTGIALIVANRRSKHGSGPLHDGSRIARARPQLTVLPDSPGLPPVSGLSFAF